MGMGPGHQVTVRSARAQETKRAAVAPNATVPARVAYDDRERWTSSGPGEESRGALKRARECICDMCSAKTDRG